ncbi:MAG: PASTA domain-containing protein, partial [Microcystaceae cyanobacterium]
TPTPTPTPTATPTPACVLPNIIGLSRSAAKAKLEAAGFKLGNWKKRGGSGYIKRLYRISGKKYYCGESIEYDD